MKGELGEERTEMEINELSYLTQDQIDRMAHANNIFLDHQKVFIPNTNI